MNSRQMRMKRRSEERKRREETRRLIEKFKSEGKSYYTADGEVAEVEILEGRVGLDEVTGNFAPW